jgi:hypothetical protein
LNDGDECDIVRRFFSYRAAQLQGLVDAVRDISQHSLTKGVEAERALADLLLSLLPSRFSAGKGFLIDTGGRQSPEFDLIILDSLNTARLFDFRVFDLIPIEAALACVEVKTTLTKQGLDKAFDGFQKIQKMEFFKERLMSSKGAGLVVSETSRPELILFAYEAEISDEAIREAYQRHPALGHVKICVLQQGIVGELKEPEGLWWLRPQEQEKHQFAGQVLALFLFQVLLPALFEQRKGQGFYVKYLEGRSTRSPLE